MSISNKSPKQFCSDKCEAKYNKNFSFIKDFNQQGSFNLIAATIENMFFNINRQSEANRKNNKRWIKDIVCNAWCDCSSNFDNNKLLKYYEDKCVK